MLSEDKRIFVMQDACIFVSHVAIGLLKFYVFAKYICVVA